jgi:hypothetical protein
MKKIVQILISFSLILLLCSNVSQPGIYNAGGMAFTMLFPEDSLAYKKVQMHEEKIYIQLYKGYAIVKGTYKMVNTSNEKLNFKMGYPINGIYNGGEVDINQVQLDSIYKFKVKSNYKELPIDESIQDESDNAMTFNNQNWLTWSMNFSPKGVNFVEVYFIVNTNDGQVAKGYNRKAVNTFVYLLESGSVWKQPIEKGNFIIELKDNLKLEDISGISSHFNFQTTTSETILVGTKSNFSPTSKDNLIITYFKHQPDFQWESKLLQSEKLFDEIDAFSKENVSQKLEPYEAKNPYEVQPDFWSFLPGLLIFAAIAIPFVLGIVLVVFLYKFIKKKNVAK